MPKQGNVLTEKQYSGAPIERAHLHRGFKAVKTPLKWIRFFRACVLQYEVANKKKKQKIKKYSFLCLTPILICIILNFLGYIPVPATIFIAIILFITLSVFVSTIRSKFNKNYTKNYDFFSKYFSAFFTLIEEELPYESRIKLTVNVKDTIDKTFFVQKENHNSKAKGFVSGKNLYYEKDISSGSCTFKDGSLIAFKFIEKLRKREVKKRGQVSGKTKWKTKYKSTYPFILKMKIPKNTYNLNPEVDKSKFEITEEPNYFVFKVSRKFSVKDEKPTKYEPHDRTSIMQFESDYFALELINLINVCYSAVKPKS